MLSKALLYVLIATTLHILLINTGWFDHVITELGYEMYAEKVNSVPVLPFPMPFNTLINLGYTLAGAVWLPTFRKTGDFWGESFCWYSIVYSFIQLARIVYQTQRTAVLDQWITTTIFCHVTIWVTSLPSGGVVTNFIRSFSRPVVLLVSFLSYFLSLYIEIGFDVALAVHMVVAVRAGYEAHLVRGNEQSGAVFGKACVCSVGFVVLKLADLPLRDYWTPNCLSGHFLSKICDVGQIYYAAELVYVLNRNLENFRRNFAD
ncbi:hypothetical protein ACHWQZ_G005909 [Mnemiopsis leidyi]